MAARILNSWKEIAVFLGRGVRNRSAVGNLGGLPVRRYGTGRRGAVFALEEEITAWLHQREQILTVQERSGTRRSKVESRFYHKQQGMRTADLILKAYILSEKTKELRQQARILRSRKAAP